jgi:hypothetical protein
VWIQILERAFLSQTPGFHHNVFADDESRARNLLQLWHDSGDVFVLIDEEDHERKFAAGIYQSAGLYPTAADEAGDSMDHHSVGDIFLAQVVEDLKMRRPALILVAFSEVDGDLNGHGRDCKRS